MALFKKDKTDSKSDIAKTTIRQVGNSTMVLRLQDQFKFESQLRKITNRIHCSPNIDAILLDLKDDILALVDAERITIYAIAEGGKEIYSKVKVGGDTKEFRVAIANTSIAGYVAKNKKMLAINDAYDLKELADIDSQLSFNRDFDQQSGFRTKQVMAVPIIFNQKLLGVMQLINKKSTGPFSEHDIKGVKDIAETLAIAFHNQQRMQRRQLSKYDLLIAENLVMPDEIEQAVQIAREGNESVEWVLINKLKVKKRDIGRALSNFYRCDFYEFKAGIPIPKSLLANLDGDYLRNNLWVPISQQGQNISIVIDNPRALQKIDDIKRQVPAASYSYFAAIPEDIIKTVDYFLGAKVEVKEEARTERFDEILSELQDGGEEIEDEIEEANESDNVIIRVVNQILTEAYKTGSSDIHFEPGMDKNDMLVRTRIDGKCQIVRKLPSKSKRAVVSRIKIMAGMDIAERRKPQDGKIQFKKYGGADIELRVATLPTVGGNEDVVLRILAASEPIPFDKLGMSSRNSEAMKKMLRLPYGIILVVGPTGSGKTTTLHSALGYINKPDIKIWTAEDPVEITQAGLRQVQVLPKIGFTFAQAMRAFLRADPDVIMVGEMRDYETAAIGIEASLTGHLVFSTLHTNSAPETIIRLLDMGIDPFNFADALIGILAQRLARTLCKQCKQSYHPDESEYLDLVKEFGGDEAGNEESFAPALYDDTDGAISQLPPIQDIRYNEQLQLCRINGCPACNNNGYRGRMGLHELLVGSDTIKRMVQDKKTVDVLRAQATKEGMTTLKQDGILKVLQGLTDIAQIRAVCIK